MENNKVKILDPKNDIVFQKLFGLEENEELLIGLLNSILRKEIATPIITVEFIDRKLDTANILDEKIGVLDVRVKTNEGIHIDVEIQIINQYNMIKRTLFYWSKMYLSQIKSGKKYNDLKRTITINILNFDYIDTVRYHTSYHLYEDEEKFRLTDILGLHFVELNKYIKHIDIVNKTPDETSDLNGWVQFLINPNDEALEVISLENPLIKKAQISLENLSRDPQTIRLAELREKALMDERSNIEAARQEGRNEGREEGREEGKVEGKQEDIIDNLRDLGGVTEDVMLKINEQHNVDTLKQWLKISARVESIEEFIAKIK